MSKRRGNNEGTIHFRQEDGTWRAQISLQSHRLSHTAKTRRECQDWIKKTILQIDNGLSFTGSQTSLVDFMEGWLIGIASSIRPTTLYQYKMVCQKHILPTIGRMKIKDIKPDMIQRLYENKLQAGLGLRTVEVIHTVLHIALEHAVKIGLIGRNPTDATTPPRPIDREMTILNESEVSELLLALRGDRFEALYYLELATGLRQSEILGLKWSDIDWSKRTLTVQRQLKRCGNPGDYFTSPKTKSGRRTIVLGMKTIAKLREHQKSQELLITKMGERWQANDMIFPSIIGTPLNQSNLYTSFKKLLRNCGLPDIRFHDLRHTSASLMLNHGVPIVVVSKRLGHSKVSVTLDVYAHMIPEMQDQAAELIDDLITPVEIELHRNCTEEIEIPYNT